MPRASAEYRWVCAQTLPGTIRQPVQSIRSAAGGIVAIERDPTHPRP